jgi:hypothetical protein
MAGPFQQRFSGVSSTPVEAPCVMHASHRRRSRVKRFALLISAVMLLGPMVDVPSARVPHRGPTSAAAQSGPQLLSLQYGKVQPTGAPRSYWALVLRARDPGRQIVAVYFQQVQPPGGGGGIADGGCGLVRQPTGRVQTTTIPIRKLTPGRYLYRFTVESGSCAPAGRGHRSTRVFAIDVR